MLVEGSRILRVRPSGIPAEMKQARRWVCWAAVPKTRRDGTLQFTKVPRRADQPSREASSTDPSNWSDFDTALAAVQDGRVAGPYTQRRHGPSSHNASRHTSSLSVADGATVREAI